MRTEPDGTITYFPLDYEGSEVAVAWYLELPENAGNAMAMVFRDGPDKPWKMVFRTRLYADDKNDDSSKDRRHGWMVNSTEDVKPETNRASLIASTDRVFQGLMDAVGGRLWRQDKHKSLAEFMETWASQPWAHSRVEKRPPPEES